MSLQTPADIPTSRSTRDADKKLAMASAKLTAHFLPSGRSLLGRSTVTLQHAFQALQLAHNSFAVGDLFSPPALLPPVMAPQCIEGRLLCFLRDLSVFDTAEKQNRKKTIKKNRNTSVVK